MSWDQNYSVPSVNELLEQLTKKTSLELLQEEAKKQGIEILKLESIVLDDGMYEEVTGYKITLSDGRVFVPKLVKQETANGNWGCDTYEYMLENETPKVEYINHDEEFIEEHSDPSESSFSFSFRDNIK